MTEPAPVPVPWPCPVRMKRWPKVMLSFDACRTIWEAMPKGLSKSQRKDLYQAAKRAVPLYRSLRSEIRLGIPRKKDEREAVVAEIAAFRAAVEAGEHPPRLSDESLGWAIRFSGPEAVDRIERARWETAAAITILEKTQEGIEGIERAPTQHADHAALGAGVQLAEDWRSITGLGTGYLYRANRETNNHGPFSLFLRAVLRVASGNIRYDGAKVAKAVHWSVMKRIKNDEAAKNL